MPSTPHTLRRSHTPQITKKKKEKKKKKREEKEGEKAWAHRRPAGVDRAIRCKSSSAALPAGFPLLSLARSRPRRL
jgi:hypothetical protein